MDQRKQGHLLDAKDLAGQRNASKVTKPQAVKKGGDSPHVTQKTTASHPPDGSRWRSLATRLRFRPKVAAVDRWRTACKAVITGDTPAKQK